MTVEACREIERLRDEGVALNAAGDAAGAVKAWTEMAKFQRRVAPSGIRYLRGESWTNGFGHLALLDMWAKRRALGFSEERHVIVTRPGIIANPFYLSLWAPWFEITDAAPPDAILREDYPMVIEVSGAFLELHHAAARIEATWRELCIPRYHPIITMPKDLIERGRERIARDGVRDWFVGMHLRQGGPHDEDSVRNVADEQTYAPAVEFIRQAGGSVLRIGERPLARPIPGVVDYGGAGDWPDCFVISQSRFFLGTNSGPSVVAGTFGVPLLIANHAPAGGLFPYRATLVRKRVVERVPGFSDGRPLSTEAWQCKNLWTTSQLEAEGLRLVDCTAAEIVAGVAKMLQETS